MKRIEVRAAGFNLAMTLNSGQVFHWEKVDPGFYGTIGDRAVYLEQDGTILRAKVDGVALPGHRVRKKYAMTRSPTSRELAPPVSELISHYFALDHPLDEICASFPLDPVMNAARDFCQGLRIIRQPRWECLATFICSSMKQVAHIRQISRALREQFGEKKEVCGHEVFSFPRADRLAGTTRRFHRAGDRARNSD